MIQKAFFSIFISKIITTYLRISVKADNRRVQARIAFDAIRFLCVFVNNEIKTNKSAQSFG